LLTVDDDRANFQGDDVRFIKRLMVNGTWDLKTFQEALQKLQLPVGKGSARRQLGTAETMP
jgi:hypothetical protein